VRPVIIGLIVVLVLILGLPAAALVIAPRLRPAKPHPRLGTADRAFHLALSRDGRAASTPPPGIPPAELGALVLPEAHYQQAGRSYLLTSPEQPSYYSVSWLQYVA